VADPYEHGNYWVPYNVGISWPAEWLLASQGLCFVQLCNNNPRLQLCFPTIFHEVWGNSHAELSIDVSTVFFKPSFQCCFPYTPWLERCFIAGNTIIASKMYLWNTTLHYTTLGILLHTQCNCFLSTYYTRAVWKVRGLAVACRCYAEGGDEYYAKL
jgi:hypothetical protein